MVTKGMQGVSEIIVTEELTAQAMGSGTLPVYATPAMIALMEGTAAKSVEGELEEGTSTVGARIYLEHKAPSPVGMKVTCLTKLIGIDENKLVFDVEAYDECGLVGKGTHERVVVHKESFQQKAEKRLEDRKQYQG